MVLPMFIILAVAVFVSQLVFSLFAKRLWIKLLPLCLSCVADLLFWGLYFLGTFTHIHGGDFAAYIFGIIFFFMTAVAGLAWGIYGIVKIVQKRRK